MNPRALTIAQEVVEACTEFREGKRQYWDDVLRSTSQQVEGLDPEQRTAVYTAIAVACSLDASYGLEYLELTRDDRVPLVEHLSDFLGDEGDASLTRAERERLHHAISLSRLESALGAADHYCHYLSELREVPFRGGTGEDVVYEGLRRSGPRAVACLIKNVTDKTPMNDPRQAPPYAGFTIGDAAVIVLSEICGMSLEEALPETVRIDWGQRGIYAYFSFVAQDPQNRSIIAHGLASQDCGPSITQ